MYSYYYLSKNKCRILLLFPSYFSGLSFIVIKHNIPCLLLLGNLIVQSMLNNTTSSNQTFTNKTLSLVEIERSITVLLAIPVRYYWPLIHNFM